MALTTVLARLATHMRELQENASINDAIDRYTTAALIGVSTRTLQRWHDAGYGPARKRLLGRPVRYSRAEVERWISDQRLNGQATLPAICPLHAGGNELAKPRR
jgi:predicted DNA-binding transcriptional regulator AlpA